MKVSEMIASVDEIDVSMVKTEIDPLLSHGECFFHGFSDDVRENLCDHCFSSPKHDLVGFFSENIESLLVSNKTDERSGMINKNISQDNCEKPYTLRYWESHETRSAQCYSTSQRDVFDECPLDIKPLNVSDEPDKGINLLINDLSKGCQQLEAVHAVKFHERFSVHCFSKHEPENGHELLDEKLISVTNERNELITKTLPSICPNIDLSEQNFKLENVFHDEIVDKKHHPILKEIDSDLSPVIACKKSESSTICSDFKSSVKLLSCFSDRKIFCEPFIVLKKLDCVRCNEQSQLSDGETIHGVNDKISSFTSLRNPDASLRYEEPRNRNVIDKSLGKSFETGRKTCLLIGKRCSLQEHWIKCLAKGAEDDNPIPRKSVSSRSTARNPHNECYHCGKRFAYRSGLANHLKQFTSELSKITHACLECGNVFLRKDNLERHMKSHRGEKPYVCETCGKSYTRSYRLKLHVRDSHTGNSAMRRCTYPNCGKTCSRYDALVSHMRTHTGVKPYLCDYCGYTCSNNSNLMHHRRTHSDEKPYKCNMCSFSSREPFHRNGHMAQHGDAGFVCAVCDIKFGTKSTLIKHLEVHERTERLS